MEFYRCPIKELFHDGDYEIAASAVSLVDIIKKTS